MTNEERNDETHSVIGMGKTMGGDLIVLKKHFDLNADQARTYMTMMSREYDIVIMSRSATPIPDAVVKALKGSKPKRKAAAKKATSKGDPK